MTKEPGSQHSNDEPSKPDEGSVLTTIFNLLGQLRASGSGPRVAPPGDGPASGDGGCAHFRVVDEIARGGMGVVMKGRDDDLGRDVAIKMLLEELSGDPLVLERFVEEAQISGQLQHPGIVPVYELGLTADQRPFFAMKLVKGGTLADRLGERADPGADRRRLLSIFESVAQTVAYAHSRHVIHRDLKPANVMVGSYGEVLVVDWGLAKVLSDEPDERPPEPSRDDVSVIATVRSDPHSDSGHSTTGTVMGTLAYMSPEQARGEVESLDERTDVFSLGAILCEILTGRPPYPKEKESSLRMAMAGAVDQALAALDGCGADEEVVALARSCLEPERSDRPADASVVAERISAWLASSEARAQAARVEAAAAREREAGERRARWLTVGLAATVLSAVFLVAEFRARSRNERAERLQRIADGVSEDLGAASFARGQGQWNEANLAIAQARARLEGGDGQEELAARIAAEELAIEQGLRAERERLALLVRRERFVREVETIRDRVARTHRKKLAAYASLFEEFGVDLGAPVEEVEGAIRASRLPEEMAKALVDWARLRRTVEGADDAEAPRLLGLALAVDADPQRSVLRRAILDGDRAELLRLAQEENSEQLDPMTVIVLSDELWVQGDTDAALELLRRTERRRPDDFHLQVKLAARYMNRLDTDGAYVHLKAALARVPDNAWVLASLGVVYLQRGDLESATAACRRAVAADPEDSYAWHYLGVALSREGDVDAAIDCLTKSVELEPEYVFALRRLGYLLSRAGRHAESLDIFLHTTEVAPQDKGALNSAAWRLAIAEPALRDPARALELATRLVALAPDDPDYLSTYGACLYRSELYAESITANERALALSEGVDRTPSEVFFLAMAHARLGNAQEARAWLERGAGLLDELGSPGTEVARLHAEARTVLGE